MKLPILAFGAALALGACTDSHGRIDPVRTGALGAAVGGGAGLIGGAIARDQQADKWHGSRSRYRGGYGYSRPRGSYRSPQGCDSYGRCW